MKFLLKLSENVLIQCKTSVLKYYNWKGINVNIEFCTILLLNTNFQNYLLLISTPENVFFLRTFFFFFYKIRYVYWYPSDLGTTHKFAEEFVLL